MIKLRKDYILNRWSYVASDRAKRPQQFKKDKTKNNKESVCYFCPGSEHLTPTEIGRVGNKNEWQVRWFLNKFPAVDESLKKEIETADKFYTNGEAFGFHEIIVETPDHDVQIFKNSGDSAGTSLVHSHSQIVATNVIPDLVQEKIDAAKKYKSCPYCEIIKSEEKSERFIYANDDFVCFAPYAPRFNYEAWIFPKKHYKNITELEESGFKNLAEIFKLILPKLEGAGISYNFYLHYSPAGKDLHFHFVIAPRVNTWAGFELATGFNIIKFSPENTAEFYRG